MEPGERVCPFCGEPPGSGVFCAACGRNLGDVDQLPTRQAWEQASLVESVPGFLARMHAAGDPGAVRMARAAPGFLGRTVHMTGWVLRPIDRDVPDGYEPGLFLTVDGALHLLTASTRGAGTRDGPSDVDLVGPEVDEPGRDERLAGELDAVRRSNGL